MHHKSEHGNAGEVSSLTTKEPAGIRVHAYILPESHQRNRVSTKPPHASALGSRGFKRLETKRPTSLRIRYESLEPWRGLYRRVGLSTVQRHLERFPRSQLQEQGRVQSLLYRRYLCAVGVILPDRPRACQAPPPRGTAYTTDGNQRGGYFLPFFCIPLTHHSIVTYTLIVATKRHKEP